MSRSDDVEYDDLSDLSTMEMDSVREWEMQFKGTSIPTVNIRREFIFSYILSFTEKYPLVGRLLKPGEEPSTYSDDEEEGAAEAASSQNHSKSE